MQNIVAKRICIIYICIQQGCTKLLDAETFRPKAAYRLSVDSRLSSRWLCQAVKEEKTLFSKVTSSR